MVKPNCDPAEVRMVLRVTIVIPIFAVVNALLNDVLVPYIDNEHDKITFKNVKPRLIIAVSWPIFLYLFFNLGLKDCD
jgi:hypothetical protein